LSATKPQEGSAAPDFALPDGDGVTWRLSEQRGKVVVLLFYPGDETPICTRQMCSVRDRWEDYAATGAEVVGISTDSAASHTAFTDHHDLPWRLSSDAEREVDDVSGANSLVPGKVERSVIVIDAADTIYTNCNRNGTHWGSACIVSRRGRRRTDHRQVKIVHTGNESPVRIVINGKVIRDSSHQRHVTKSKWSYTGANNIRKTITGCRTTLVNGQSRIRIRWCIV